MQQCLVTTIQIADSIPERWEVDVGDASSRGWFGVVDACLAYTPRQHTPLRDVGAGCEGRRVDEFVMSVYELS